MKALPSLVIGWLVTGAIGRHYPRSAPWAGAGVGLIAWRPVVGLGVVAAGSALLARRALRRRRRIKEEAEADVVLLGELVGLALSAGLTFPAALGLAAGEVAPPLAAELEGVRRDTKRRGLSVALGNATGMAERLYLLAARAIATGAPLHGAVAAFVDESRHAERARRLEAARRLPVRLLLPLALLILPGFVVLSVGPAFLGSLERLQFALPSVIGRLPT